MKFQYLVTVEVNHTTGRFASRDDIAQQIQEELENAGGGTYSSDNGGEYETGEWAVEEYTAPKPEKRKRGDAPANVDLTGIARLAVEYGFKVRERGASLQEALAGVSAILEASK